MVSDWGTLLFSCVFSIHSFFLSFFACLFSKERERKKSMELSSWGHGEDVRGVGGGGRKLYCRKKYFQLKTKHI